MRRVPLAALGLAALLPAGAARAAYMDLCCDSVAHPDGSCVASEESCPPSAGFALSLHDLTVPFPPGVDGYTYVTEAPPWWGLCFLAPEPRDPNHLQPATPIACMTTTLVPGVGAEVAVWSFPDGPWDAIELCYGPQVVDPSTKKLTCQLPAAGRDPTLSLTSDGSTCCGPPRVLGKAADPQPTQWGWTFDLGQEIPGVLAPSDPGVEACTSPACGQLPADAGARLPVDAESPPAIPNVDTAGCSAGGAGSVSWAAAWLLAAAFAVARRPISRRV
jgi:hypothetical protein